MVDLLGVVGSNASEVHSIPTPDRGNRHSFSSRPKQTSRSNEWGHPQGDTKGHRPLPGPLGEKNWCKSISRNTLRPEKHRATGWWRVGPLAANFETATTITATVVGESRVPDSAASFARSCEN